MRETFPEAMIEALSYWTRDALFSLGGSDEALTGVRLSAVPDGSGNWAVCAATHDRDGREHVYRTVIDSAGLVVSAAEV